MTRPLLLVLMLAALTMADNIPDSWIVPIRIHYANGRTRLAWTQYRPSDFYSRETERAIVRKPLPGKSVFYMNKLGATGHLLVGDTLHALPDSFVVLVSRRLSLEGVELVEDASADSLPAIGTWSDHRVDQATGEVLLRKRPAFVDRIVLDDELAYEAEHVYCYDSSFTAGRIRKLYARGGRRNPVLARALRERRVVLILERSP